MKAFGKYLAIILTALCIRAAFALPSVTIDSVAQRWPWNKKVDITYTVVDGQNVANNVFRKLVFTATIAGTDYVIDGSSIGASASDGRHIATWTPPSDLKVVSPQSSMTAALYATDVPSGDDYMIVDLSNGSISYEGLLATQNVSNERYTNYVYKTDLLVLRKVAKGGTYRTGHTDRNSVNSPKYWTTDRDYYIGVFSLTRAQYKKLMGSVPGWAYGNWGNGAIMGGDKNLCPVDSVTWEGLRGEGVSPTNAVAAKADGTFFERLNALTLAQSGVKGFDLPTEVMFEIAARAGAETLYFFGDDRGTENEIISQYTWGWGTSNSKSAGVGLKKPNAWGLYDVIGNTGEWLRDDDSLANLANAVDPWTPACSAEATDNRRIRGYGIWTGVAGGIYKASNRDSQDKEPPALGSSTYTNDKNWLGCRVAWIAQ